MKLSRSFALVAAFGLLIVPARADAPLRKGDQFDLRLGGVPGDDVSLISSNYTIDGEGCLNLSYIGKVQVEGKTASEIQSAIEHAYIEHGIFTHPTVSISVGGQTRLITFGGEVNSKARVPYTPDMTIMQAIGAAGDFTIFADQKHVRLNRGDKVMIINCARIRSHPGEDIKVLPGDSIYVPQSFL